MTTIKIKKGAGTPSGLTFGELAYDVTNKKLFIGITGGNALLANTDGGVASFNGLTGAITGVASIRGLTGAVGITNGTGIGLSVSGQTMTFSNTGVLSVNGSTGTITNVAKTNEVTNFEAQYNTLTVTDTSTYDSIIINPTSNKIVFFDGNSENEVQLYVSSFGNQVITFPDGTTTLAGLAESQTFTDTNTFSTLTNFLSGISAAGGVTFSGTLKGVTASFTGLVSSTVGFSGPGTNLTNIVKTFNGLTGAVTGVTVGGANTFTALNTFNAGLSGNINISSTNVTGNVMYLLMARGTGVTGVFIDNVTTPLIYNPFQGNLGLKGITLSSGSDTLSILPGQVTANNSTNNAYFYFIANGGNYFQSPVLSSIGDIGAVNSALTLNVDPSSRTMTWSDATFLTGVTSGFFGVNRSPYGMLSDYAVEINSPTGKGIQLMYNDYTGAVSNSVKMDVSSAGNYTVLPSGGLATITGTLNVSAGISAAGGVTFSGTLKGVTANFTGLLSASAGISAASGVTFSGNVAMTSTSSHTGLASFAGGLSASGGITFSAPITSTRMARHTSAAISAQKTVDFTPTAAEDGTVFYINYSGKGSVTVTFDSLPIGWRAKFLNVGSGEVYFESTGDIYGEGSVNPSASSTWLMEAICIATNTYFIG